MALDFNRLNDPAVQAEMRARRVEEERVQAAKDDELKGLLEKCVDSLEQLPERERNFIRSCRSRLLTYLQLSEAQERWLRDIAARL